MRTFVGGGREERRGEGENGELGVGCVNNKKIELNTNRLYPQHVTLKAEERCNNTEHTHENKSSSETNNMKTLNIPDNRNYTVT